MFHRAFKCCLVFTRKYNADLHVGYRHLRSFEVRLERMRNLCLVRSLTSTGHRYCSADASEQTETEVTTKDRVSSHMVAQQQLELLKSNPETEKLMKIIQLEVDLLKQENLRAPEVLGTHHWVQLLQLQSRTARRKYLAFLWLKEQREKIDQLKREKARKEKEENLKTDENEESDRLSRYGLSKNTMFLRIYDTKINQFRNGRWAQALQFGEKLVVDLGYEKHMTIREINNCAKQLTLLLSENRNNREPLDLYFCNANTKGPLLMELYHTMPNLYDDSLPLNIKSESYLDVFDKEQLIYLTPHCRTEMECFDPNMVYIIGAIVDKTNNEPLSMAKAKKEGIRMMKFPLDRYLDWGAGGTKSLTLNQTLAIILDLKATGDWEKALKHVPRRKLNRSSSNFMSNEKRTRSRPVMVYPRAGPYQGERETRTEVRNSYKPSGTLKNFSYDTRRKMFDTTKK